MPAMSFGNVNSRSRAALPFAMKAGGGTRVTAVIRSHPISAQGGTHPFGSQAMWLRTGRWGRTFDLGIDRAGGGGDTEVFLGFKPEYFAGPKSDPCIERLE